jgi:hypothetical protein
MTDNPIELSILDQVRAHKAWLIACAVCFIAGAVLAKIL